MSATPPPPPKKARIKQGIKIKLGLTIGTKLVGLIAALLMSSVAGIVYLSTRMFIEDNTALIQQMNADTASSLATQMREYLENLTEKMRVLGTIMVRQSAQNTQSANSLIAEFFSKDKDLLAVFVHQGTESGFAVQNKAISPEMTTLGDSSGEKALDVLLSDKEFSLSLVAQGEVQVTTFSTVEGNPIAAVAIPFIQKAGAPNEFTHTLTALVRQGRLSKPFSDSELVTSFMADRQGRLLAHSDTANAVGTEDVSQVAIVREMITGKATNKQMRYIDQVSSEARLGAFRLVGFAGLGVVAEVAEAKAFQAARKVEYRAMLLAVMVLCLSFLLGYLYSGTITWPIKQLMEAARQIAHGNFAIHLKPRGRDEIAHLSTTFNEMAKGLEERDRVKETFNKFHNREIAEKLLSGAVALGGERKEATVFFSDVRGFTALSESMEPEQVVEMLNEYMTRMVSIIRSHGGVVDKYVGDAIMALWGVPLTGTNDTYNAVRACLAMRDDLAKLNELRLSRGQPVLKIGMGLNRGPLIAGNIGSEEKMEYTVIGDAVNLASRIESMTKEYGTDLLISTSVVEQVGNRFVLVKGGSTKVKGKSNAIDVYKVSGYVNDQGQAVLVETPYSSYAAEKSDKVVHEAGGAHEPATPEPATPEPETSAFVFDTTQITLETKKSA